MAGGDTVLCRPFLYYNNGRIIAVRCTGVKIKLKKKVKRIVLLVISVAMIIIVSVLLWDIFRTISTEAGRIEFRDRILELGVPGCLMLIGLNVSQIFLFFFPGEMVELLAGMCYGVFGGLLVTYIGVFISTAIIFWLVRKIGKASVYDLIGEDKIEKIENSRLYKSRKAEWILLLLFILPGTPKDLLIYVGALLPVNTPRFILLSTLFRFPGIITSTIAGAYFAKGNSRTAIIVYVVTFIVSLILLRVVSRKEEIREIMKINKD